tara:strand:+ start:11695 stop:11874 length:180 start_codon:yes stop_codon:yes gene_type:complete
MFDIVCYWVGFVVIVTAVTAIILTSFLWLIVVLVPCWIEAIKEKLLVHQATKQEQENGK